MRYRITALGAALIVSAGTVLTGFVGVAASRPAAAAAEIHPVPASGTVDVVGHGYGHGHGMSQYGAKGAALRGASATQILNFYYPGTRVASLGGAVRVRFTAADAAPLVVQGVAGLRAQDGTGRVVPLGASRPFFRVVYDARTGRLLLQGFTGTVYATKIALTSQVTFFGPAVLHVYFPRAKSTCRHGHEAYIRGPVRSLPVYGLIHSVGYLPLDSYLRGVVPAESPSSWPAAALQAQAVAARSYAAYKRSTAGTRWYDLYDSTQDQCFDGATAERASTNAAIAATAGKVRTYGGRPIFAQYSSSDGGWTSAGSVPYLAAKADPWEAYSGNPYTNWSTPVSPATLAGVDGPGGLARVTRVRITARDGAGQWGGRVVSLAVEGYSSTGSWVSVARTGEQLRSYLRLKSRYFTLSTG